MRKVVLFIAMSLDGCIADPQGGVGWLDAQGAQPQEEDPYDAFIKDVDAVVMGWNTYHQIVTALSPGAWPYEGIDCYVVTHRALPANGRIFFTGQSPCDLVRRLRCAQGKSIWICGGAKVARPLMQQGLIDEYEITIVPTVLGDGIRLFAEDAGTMRLKPVSAQLQGEMLHCRFLRAPSAPDI